MSNRCPTCFCGQISETTVEINFDFTEITAYITTDCFRCEQCGELFLTLEQQESAEMDAAAFALENNIFTGKAFKCIRQSLRLSRKEAARLSGVEIEDILYWETGSGRAVPIAWTTLSEIFASSKE
jgi:DNA-binding transcriptional regulator YiaG